MSNAAPDFSFDVVLLKRDEFRRGGLLLPRPACGRAIAYDQLQLCVDTVVAWHNLSAGRPCERRDPSPLA
jgi:hypothetical protein